MSTMVVQHNMQAMNANRVLGITTAAQAKSTEKLSSGYRINRAADDAAGLSISEKMRKQIKGLDRASTNAEDGVSAVQTAEGALTEVHSMLQRMNELATQAANGTNSESDRQSIQNEIDQLTTEIDRVSETTKFNETYLLKGDENGATKTINVNAHDAGIAGTLTDNGSTASFKVKSDLNDGDKITIAGKEYTIGNGTAGSASDFSDISATNWITGVVGTKSVSAGDTLYDESDNTTYKLVDDVTINSTSGAINGSVAFDAADTITITDANGNDSTYTVSGTTSLQSNTLSQADAGRMVKEALDAGSSVTYHSNVQNKDYNVVDSFTQNNGGTYEISSYGTTSPATAASEIDTVAELVTASGITLAEGDAVTVNGATTTATDYKPATTEQITNIISNMQTGEKISINNENGASTIEIATETDAVNGKYTVADALSLIGENDDVEFLLNQNNSNSVNAALAAGLQTTSAAGTSANGTVDTSASSGTGDLQWYTPVTSIGSLTSDDSDTITKADALTKIADELAKASSIGTDANSGATVANNGDGTFTITKGTTEVAQTLNFNLHVGADADMTNKIGVGIETMNSSYLGVKGLDVVGQGNDGGIAATYAIDAIADAISKVSSQRSALGAVQNRLEHTIANLDNVVENTTSAESRIRDTDMAETMVEYSKNNILAQAGQSMLAQANQSTQGVLSLLG